MALTGCNSSSGGWQPAPTGGGGSDGGNCVDVLNRN